MGKDERLKSRRLIERVFREGRSFSVYPFRVHFLLIQPAGPSLGQEAAHAVEEKQEGGSVGGNPRKSPVLQAGFGASSRHFKKAVDRNRIKRLSKEAYRIQKEALRVCLAQGGGAMALFFIYTGKEIADLETIRGKIRVALHKLVKEVGG